MLEEIPSDQLFLLVVFGPLAIVSAVAFFTRGTSYDIDGIPSGLGGWLAFPIAGFLLVLLWSGYQLLDTFSGENFENLINIFSVEKEDIRGALRLPILGTILFQILLIISAFFCLLCVWRRKKIIQWAAFLHYSLLFAASFFAYWSDGVTNAIFPDLNVQIDRGSATGSSTNAILIWLVYFFQSKRVQKTFVN
jgi:Protein of unknown function (DUF2569)